jgi:NAD-dependent dihydropyrimidine dehydrogenase PreA subunit
VVDRNRCEADRDCVAVCPYDVFEVRKLEARERSGMSFIGTLKSARRGFQQAVVLRPQDCHACGLCVKGCPENAITLVKLPTGGTAK